MGGLILSPMHLPARDMEPRSRVDASSCVCGEEYFRVESSHFRDLLPLAAAPFLVNWT